MRTIYVKIGFHLGSKKEFGISATLETDYGAVIELWGEYFINTQLREALLNVLDNSLSILSRIYEGSFREIQIVLDEVLKNNANISLEELKDHLSMLLSKYGLGIEYLDIIYVSFGPKSRYNSLARKAFELKSRYPPIIRGFNI